LAFHPDITRKDDVTVALDTANAAVKLASRQMTGNAGSVTIPNADGTKTVLGVDAGETGVAPWVGDTTAPGKPLGLSVESHNGAIWVTWDGTLDGGIPADFSHIQVSASYDATVVDMGRLTAAGTVTAAELPAGSEVTASAVAYDDAHAADGSSAPNASPVSDVVTVIVQSAVDAAQVQQAQDDAQSALDKAGQASDTATSAKNTAEGANTLAANANATATSANSSAQDASSTAATALAAAQSAQNDTVTGNVTQWAQNSDPTTAPTTGWSNTAPSWTTGTYIWARTIIAYGSGDYETTDPVIITGNPGPQGVIGPQGSTGARGATGAKGDKGDTGARGPAGADGADGTSVKIKGTVSTASALPSSATEGDGYITNDTGHLHVWGDNGWSDVGVIRGPNGVNAYVHAAWSDSSDGKTNFSTTDGGTRSYMGVYSDNTAADSTTPSDYTWTKIVGPTGAKGATGDKGATGAQGSTGADGAKGDTGVSVSSITPYWALGTSAPAKPAVSAPPSPWVASEPGYQRNQNLYTTQKVTYSNGAFSYTPVQLDSSYQYSAAAETAAQDALQSATNANTAAQTAQTAATNANSAATSAATKADNASSAAIQAQSTATAAAQAATSAQTAANLAIANAENLILNGDPDGTYSSWSNTSNNSVSFDTDNSFLVKRTSASKQDLLWNRDIEKRGGAALARDRTFLLEADFKLKDISTTPSGYVNVATHCRVTAWGRIQFNAPLSNFSTDSWYHVSVTGVIPAGEAVLDVYLTAYFTGNINIRKVSFKDITEAKAAQDAANTAQTAADTAQTAAANAVSIANAAKAAAQGAQTTADGKNKIFSATSEPAHTGLVPGDLWFQTNSSTQVIGIQTWNGSKFVDYLVVANEILVAGSVGTTQIKNGAITTDLLTSNAVTAIKIAAQTITGDKLNVGSVASAIMTSNLFKTSGTSNYTIVNDSGITVYKNGTPYSHMGSDTAYGLQLWNPYTSSMVEASSMVFGITPFISASQKNIVPPGNDGGFNGWTFEDLPNTFTAPSPRAFGIFSYTTALNDDVCAVNCAAILRYNGSDVYAWNSNPKGYVALNGNTITYMFDDLVVGRTYNVRFQWRGARMVNGDRNSNVATVNRSLVLFPS
jgi:hypothetical protein